MAVNGTATTAIIQTSRETCKRPWSLTFTNSVEKKFCHASQNDSSVQNQRVSRRTATMVDGKKTSPMMVSILTAAASWTLFFYPNPLSVACFQSHTGASTHLKFHEVVALVV